MTRTDAATRPFLTPAAFSLYAIPPGGGDVGFFGSVKLAVGESVTASGMDDYNDGLDEDGVLELPMSAKKQSSRKTNRVVRMPATRFGHLQKRMRKRDRPLSRFPLQLKK